MAAYDLTTVAAVREFTQTPVGETEWDAVTQTLISAASRAISRHCDQEFAPALTSTARTFEWDPSNDLLDVAPYSLRTVTLVRTDTDLTPTTLTAEQYRLWPYPSVHGVYSGLRLDAFGAAGYLRWRKRLVEITGTWGFASVPEDVAQACILTVAIWLRRDVSTASTTFSIDEGRLERPEALPSAVRGMLTPFKRMSV